MDFVANFICCPAVQKFWTSVKISQSYRELKGAHGNFFLRQCILCIFYISYSSTDSNERQWKNFDKCSAVAEMGDRLTTIDVGRKEGAAVPLSGKELGPDLTQCRLGQALPRTEWYLDPSSRLGTIHQRYRQTDRTTVRQHKANRFTNGHPKIGLNLPKLWLLSVLSFCNTVYYRPIYLFYCVLGPSAQNSRRENWIKERKTQMLQRHLIRWWERMRECNSVISD